MVAFIQDAQGVALQPSGEQQECVGAELHTDESPRLLELGAPA